MRRASSASRPRRWRRTGGWARHASGVAASVDAEAEVRTDPAGAVARGAAGLAPARVDAGAGQAADFGDARTDDRQADRGHVVLEGAARGRDREAAAALGLEPAGAAPARRAGGVDDAARGARLGLRRGGREGDGGGERDGGGGEGEDGFHGSGT